MRFAPSSSLKAAIVTLSIAIALFLTTSAHAVLIGNALTSRNNISDGAADLLYTNFVAMPGPGFVRSANVYYQGAVPSQTFNDFQLRATGTLDEYQVVYDSGNIIPSGTLNSPSALAFPNGGTYVRGGDIFAHYGRGIPYSDLGGLNVSNAHAIYYQSPSSPSAGTNITLGIGAYPQNNSFIRDYASAVDFQPVVGNELTPRANVADGALGVFYSNFVPMPSAGVVDSVNIFYQGDSTTFNMYLLRPNGGQYDVIYDSGTITPSGIANSVITLPFPNGAINPQAGDIFAHYGRGIPYSNVGQLNALNTHAIYYQSLNAPVAGTSITLPSGEFPQNNSFVRDYAWAVSFVVPEPSSAALLIFGMAGLFSFARRRKI